MSTFWTRVIHWLRGRSEGREFGSGWVEPANGITARALRGPVTLPGLSRDPWALSFELQTPLTQARLAASLDQPAATVPARAVEPPIAATVAPPVRHVVDDLADQPVREPLRLPTRAA